MPLIKTLIPPFSFLPPCNKFLDKMIICTPLLSQNSIKLKKEELSNPAFHPALLIIGSLSLSPCLIRYQSQYVHYLHNTCAILLSHFLYLYALSFLFPLPASYY